MEDKGEALERARELVEEARIERRLTRRLELVLKIEDFGDPTHDPDLAELFAEGLHLVALAEDGNPELRLALAGRLGALRDAHGTLTIAALEARVLAAATSGMDDPASCLEVARRIDLIGARYRCEPLALAESIACFNAAAIATDGALVGGIVARLQKLLAAYPHELIARHLIGALVCASALTDSASEAWQIEAMALQLAADWPTRSFTEEHAKVLANAIDAELEPARRQRGMRQLRDMLARHASEAIALVLAHALYQVHGVEGSAAECRYAADEITELNETYRSAGIALAAAQVLRNGTAESTDPEARRAFGAELEALADDYPEPAVAAQVVHGLSNEFLALDDPVQRLDLLERMCALLRRFPDDESAERASLALALEQQTDLDLGRQRRRELLAHGLVAARPSLLEPLRRAVEAVVGRTHDGDAIERVEALLRP
ncbi:MAG: hypothetical protein R3F49_13050 [Planctomycetota bacterium]